MLQLAVTEMAKSVLLNFVHTNEPAPNPQVHDVQVLYECEGCHGIMHHEESMWLASYDDGLTSGALVCPDCHHTGVESVR